MTLVPLLSASAIVQLHAAAAVAAIGLGAAQLWLAKGTTGHRVLGWLWAILIAAVALSSFWISGERFRFGPFSWIHALSIFTLVVLPIGLLRARRHQVRQHGTTMVFLYVGALVISGLFTLAPARIIGRSIFGG